MSAEHLVSPDREKVRLKLTADKVKLWLPPFTLEGGQRGERPEELISRYHSELGIAQDTIAEIIEDLRVHALKKFTERSAGLVAIKIKFAGRSHDNSSANGSFASYPSDAIVNICLRSTGVELKRQISETFGVPYNCLKLISCGRVVQDDDTLEQQQIRNNSYVMALCLSAPEANAVEQQQQASKLSRMREAAELFNSHEDDDSHYSIQIADQSGRPLDLPRDERKALTLAMMLHEKGRAALKRKEFGESLIFLLEADSEFKKCRSSILSLVDNYAIVCLDIVWCYLCLQNIHSLPDAEARLEECERCFHKSYGANLERLTVLKGGSGEEAALFVRLHLLQGILAFHQQNYEQARVLLRRAENELSLLRANEEDMTSVMEMGFSELEARLGLRACRGDVQAAVSHIVQRREEKRQLEEKEREERRKKRLERKLGYTSSGAPVNIEHYNSLVSMKFAKGAAAEALRQADNDITIAFQILHERPELLNLPDPDPPNTAVSEAMIQQLCAMGFDANTAHAALHHFSANVDRAVEELLRLGGSVPPDWLQNLPNIPSNSNSDESVASSTASQKHERELMDEIIPDLPQSDDDYLDLTLDDEASFLQEYNGRILSLD